MCQSSPPLGGDSATLLNATTHQVFDSEVDDVTTLVCRKVRLLTCVQEVRPSAHVVFDPEVTRAVTSQSPVGAVDQPSSVIAVAAPGEARYQPFVAPFAQTLKYGCFPGGTAGSPFRAELAFE